MAAQVHQRRRGAAARYSVFAGLLFVVAASFTDVNKIASIVASHATSPPPTEAPTLPPTRMPTSHPTSQSPMQSPTRTVLSPPVGFYDQRPISFTHIPKCSGTSFTREMHPRKANQDCYNHMRHSDKMNCVFLRSPRAHVQSQFLECVYDGWGKKVTKHTAFPRTKDKDDDFESWIRHFVQLNNTQVGPEVDFNCIDPRDTQTRHMSCLVAPNPRANHALLPLPNLTAAIANVVSDATFIGLTDFYHESMCILKLRRTGSLPESCGCSEGQKALRLHKHVTHGVPQHKPIFSKEVTSMVDSMTKSDRPLFVAPLKRFLKDVDVAEQVANSQFLCNRTKALELLELYENESS